MQFNAFVSDVVVLLTILDSDTDRAGNKWRAHRGQKIYARSPNPGKAYGLIGALWSGRIEELVRFEKAGKRWVVWTVEAIDVVAYDGTVVWAKRGQVLFSGGFGETLKLADGALSNWPSLLEGEDN